MLRLITIILIFIFTLNQITFAFPLPATPVAICFDEYGNILQDTAQGFQPFAFAGGLYDEHTGLVRFGARDYDSTTGRWTAKDPTDFGGGDTNLYRYCFADPVNYVDATGKIIQAVGGLILREIAKVVGKALIQTALTAAGIAGLVSTLFSDDNESTENNPDCDRDKLRGNNPREKGNRINTDLPGGSKEAEQVFGELTRGQQIETTEEGHKVARGDGTRLRINPDGTARIDRTASGDRKHETIHFNN